MVVLGFRRPQFSEEAAWLPEWLQNSQNTGLDKFMNESEIKVSEEKGSEREASEEGQYNNCHLFLSGSDNTASSLPSTAIVLHLNLHLSSDGTLQYTQGPSLYNYPIETAIASSSHLEEVRVPVEVRQSSGTLGSENFPSKPTSRENLGLTPKSPFSKEKHIKRIKGRPRKYGNFDHAVELSIAASETLIIRELLENCKPSAEVEASALLDISLKVKQARLLGVEEDSFSNDQLDESCEGPSDLDDSLMVDAFVDVGLSTTSSGDCNVSHGIVSRVNESPQHDLEASCNLVHSECLPPEGAPNCTSKTFSEENWDMDREVKFMNGESPILNCDIVGLELFASGQGNAKSKTTELQAGFNMPKLDSSSTQPRLAAKSSHLQDHNVPEDFQLKHRPSGGFTSCWLGDWKRKDDGPGLTIDTRKCIPKALAVETSSLSESVDVPDMSSYVDGQESKCLTSSQACSAANVVPLANLVEGQPLISPEIAKPSSSLSIDPLCSVVPCSYLSETPQSLHNEQLFRKGGEYLDENDPCLASKFLPNSLSLTSDRMVSVRGAAIINDKVSDLKVQKHLGSLHKYSVVLGKQNETGTVLIPREQHLFQSVSGKESCYFKSNNDASIACGDAIGTRNLTNDVTLCNNNAKRGAGSVTPQPEQRLSVFNMKGIKLPQASEGQCSDKECDCTASQRVSDDFPLRKKSHASQIGVALDIQVLQRKRVHFKEDKSELEQSKWFQVKKRKTGSGFVSNMKSKMPRISNLEPQRETFSQEVKKKLTNYRSCNGDKLIFRGLEFLLTGLPKRREKEVEQLIIRYGGIVLFDIPPPSSKGKLSAEPELQKLPVVLCLKKVETTKFLYGCAVNAFILKVDWLLDSVSAGSVLQPENYMIFSNRKVNHTRLRSPHVCKLVFEGVGIMFHGKYQFCARLSRVFKCGGGRVYKALQRLVQSCERKKLTIQVVVAEDRSTLSRHLKHCAKERNIPIVSATWITSSLLSGKLLSFTENDYHVPKPTRKASPEMLPLSSCLSQEI